MKRFLFALATLGLSAGAAVATPGDPRVLQGTLEWPATITNEAFVVMRGEDGRLYYTDISAAQRRIVDPMTSGSRMAVLGVEGSRPYEISALVIGAGDAASLGVTPSGTTTVSAPPPPPAPPASAIASPPSEPMWRVDGTVQTITEGRVTLRRSDSDSVTVDVSNLSDRTLAALRPGDRVSLFGVPRKDNRLVANGYIQSEAASPSASPSSRR